jgi:septal ring factor EnvC (AmiA/AmiB activator)
MQNSSQPPNAFHVQPPYHISVITMSSTPSGMASAYPITNLAAALVSQIPTLVERLRQYDEQHQALDKRCENLEKEIIRVKKSLANEQVKQKMLRERMDESDMGGSTFKRKRVDGQFTSPTIHAGPNAEEKLP